MTFLANQPGRVAPASPQQSKGSIHAEIRVGCKHRHACRGTERNRTLQLLESAGIKLAGVASDVFGASGMLMLRALAEGSADAAKMADVAKRWLRRKVDQLVLALDGQLAEYQRLLLGLHIRRFAEIDRDLAEIEAAISDAMRSFATQRACLATIPGRGRDACGVNQRGRVSRLKG